MTRMLTVAAVSAAFALTVHTSLPNQVAPTPADPTRWRACSPVDKPASTIVTATRFGAGTRINAGIVAGRSEGKSAP